MNGEEDFLRTIEELQQAVRARDDFLAIAAHELRNPMHALLLQVDSALGAARRGGNRDIIRRLERVKSAVDRYVKRATTLLDISRINADRLKLRFEDVDFAEVIRDAVESYAVEATFNGVDLCVTAPESLHGRWDRVAVDQIVSNLVSNAIKYGDGQRVDVVLARDGSTARLEIRDHGGGISPEDQARIFNRFEQLITEHSRSGFGIGLWLVRTLVEAHRGSIGLESAAGQGTTFTVQLPLDPSSGKQEVT